MTDLQLLADYSRNRSEKAFADLVERYVRLVHSACWRQLGDAQLAEDATQTVFVLLSQRAGKLRHEQLAGWLLTTAHFTCSNMRRSEARRHRREQVAAMNHSNEDSHSQFESNSELPRMLDEALLRLRASDRDALALRFLQGQPLRQVGESLGVSEDAARKRVDRGLEKLRQFFRNRGFNMDSTGIAVLLADQSHGPAVAESLMRRIVQANRTPASSPRLLRPKFAVVGSIAVVGIVGAAGWGMFWRTPVRLANDPVAAAPAGDPAPAAADQTPATQPAHVAPDRSTPDNALISLCHAMLAADRDDVYACLLFDPNLPEAHLDNAAMQYALAARRMILTGQKIYGPEASKMLGNGLPVDVVMQAMIALRQMQGATAKIDGDSAIINVEIPPVMIQATPPDIRAVLIEWSGKPLRFRLRDGAWQIDVERSIRMVLKVQRQRRGPIVSASDREQTMFFEQQAKDCDLITGRIIAGKLPRLSDGEQAVQSKIRQMCGKLGILNFSSYTAPAKSGQP